MARFARRLHTLYYTLHTEHAYCLSYRFLNNVVVTTVIEMIEMVEILDGRLGKRSVERVRYVINNLLHLVIVKYGDISLVLCISTRLRLVTILSLLVKYLIILHADPCNKSYIYIARLIIEHHREWLASLADNIYIYIARLIIEHPREWLASLADYPARLRARVKTFSSSNTANTCLEVF